MRYLFISPNGETLSLAHRTALEGHDSIISSRAPLGDGAARHTTYSPNIHRTVAHLSPDITIFSSPTTGSSADELRSRGYRVAFSSVFSRTLATNSQYNTTLLKSFDFSLADDTTQGYFLTAEGIFNGSQFISRTLSQLTHHLFSDSMGPLCDASGSVMWSEFSHTRLCAETLDKLEQPLRKVSYRGPVSLDFYANEQGIFAHSLHARYRPATFSSLIEGTKIPVSDLLFALSTGEGIKAVPIDSWVVSVALSVPPWPRLTEGVPTVRTISGISPANIKHLYLQDVSNIDGTYVCNGLSGCIGFVCARGKDSREARRRAYRTISNIRANELQYRGDVGRGAYNTFCQLHVWGWI